jgi:integrase
MRAMEVSRRLPCVVQITIHHSPIAWPPRGLATVALQCRALRPRAVPWGTGAVDVQVKTRSGCDGQHRKSLFDEPAGAIRRPRESHGLRARALALITAKSDASGSLSRTVALPALAIEELRRYRVKQAEDLLKLGVRQTDQTHVCLRANYEPWPPRNLTHTFKRVIRASGLAWVRLHDLRHSHATHLLTANVHPKIVQERLGHATIAMTIDLYSHVMPGMQADAAARVDDALRAALKNRGG